VKQLLVLSGKGGTGKTTLVAAFVERLKAKAYADCDVDAPNLHLVMEGLGSPDIRPFYGMEKAAIDASLCTGCGDCKTHCRFGAISRVEASKQSTAFYQIDPYACEGCAVCEYVCSEGAVTLGYQVDGETKVYHDQTVFSTATLQMGSGNSGKLVSEVKKNMRTYTENLERDVAIIDGSPGIGCPVIASISGVDLILLVTEPTLSGISDMKRVIEIAEHFKTPIAICTNKYDVNPEKTREIKAYAKQVNIPYVGDIPYDKQVAVATNQGVSILKVPSRAGIAILAVFDQTIQLLQALEKQKTSASVVDIQFT